MNNVSSSSQLVGEREASRRQALRVVKKQNFRHVIHSKGQRIYIRECDPKKTASMVIDNADVAAPVIVKRRE